MQLERSDRQAKVESSRLNAEITSLRQRLDRGDGDLIQARRENLRLADQVSNLEKEVCKSGFYYILLYINLLIA